VRERVAEAFELVLEAERAGGDVGGLVSSLNRALELVAEAELSSDPVRAGQLLAEAEGVVDGVVASAPVVRDEGLAAQRSASVWLALELAFLGVLGVSVYLFGPRLFWRFWLRVYGGWRVRAR
jgi:hypothetical protein